MDGGRSRLLEVVVLIAVTAGAACLLAGLSLDTQKPPSPNAHAWFVWSGALFGFSVLVTLLYFIVHPAIVGLDARRTRVLQHAEVSRGQIRPALTIIKAEYGANQTWVDVTEILVAVVSNGQLTFTVANTALGGDPLPDVPKRLRVEYDDAKGKRHMKDALESATLTLP